MKNKVTEIQLAREMTLFDATLIGVGAMIGAGIFVLIGIAAGVAGPALIITFVLNGLVALLTAMSYAELGSCYHSAGGGYLWIKEGLPKAFGFLSGWMDWFGHSVACSLYALGFGAYFGFVLNEMDLMIPDWGFFSPQKILAVSAAILFAYVNFRGASETGKIGNLITMAKIIILLIFIGFGLELVFRHDDWQNSFTPFFPNGYGGVFKAMGLTFIAFQGFEIIAQSSEEIKNPKRNIPLAIFYSLLIVIPIYILVAFVSIGSVETPVGMMPWDVLAEQKEIALVGVARGFFIGGGVLILVGGLMSTISALNATIYSSSRVAFAMGRDRYFPTFLSKIHKKNFTPHWSILFSLFIIVFMAVSLPIEDVASAADIIFLLLFLLVNVAMIKLRKKKPELDRGYKVPLFPYVSILAISLLLFLAVYMLDYSVTAWMITIIWIGLGLLVYKFYSSDREIKYLRKVNILDQIAKKQYNILICFSNSDDVRSLSSVAFAIAKKYDARLIFLHVIELDEGTKLREGLQNANPVNAKLEEASKLAEEIGVSSKSIIKISHRISQGIVDTLLEENCNFILTGRNKKSNLTARIFTSVIDDVLEKATNEVAILHGEIKSENIKNIFIPFGGDIHTELAIEIAPSLAQFYNANINVGIVFSRGADIESRQLKIDQVKTLLDENNLSADIRTITDTDLVHGIVKLSEGADLMVMGGKSDDFLELLFGKSLVREITGQVECPVLWLKEYEERTTFVRSLFKTSHK
ncbi:MAG TPA: amino acid transporter [Flavobacteriales bacterium]|nr:amino acid transporter [Flavobacteriales bacterium]